MELVINLQSKPRIRSSYELSVMFALEDSNQYERSVFRFHESKLQDPSFKEELELFVKHLDEACRLDSRGRRGFESRVQCKKHYGVIPNWERFCHENGENHEPTTPYTEFKYMIPTDDNGYYMSYSESRLEYYDVDGDMHSVEIKM